MKLVWLIPLIASALIGPSIYAAPGPWDQPAADLADQIASILGPGQARLIIRNLSALPIDEIPTIRLLLEQDLKARGVLASGVESANTIRVTLSENLRERLWVAEIVEGAETRVAIVHLAPGTAQPVQPATGITLRKQPVLTASDRILAALETPDGLVAVEPEVIVIFNQTPSGLHEQKRFGIGQKRSLARDPRAVIVASPDGSGFEAYVPAMACTGVFVPAQPAGEWTVHCSESDDPWPILQGPTLQSGGSISIKAFYNAARDYFTGVVTPSVDVDLLPFYSAALLPRADGAGLLIDGIDGKVQIAESGALKSVAGTRDWGSDFAAINTGCASSQIVASGSGEAISDSLRAYDLPRHEAIPASAPLAMGGAVMALWSAPDGKSIFAVVETAQNQYEVDRVTAICN